MTRGVVSVHHLVVALAISIVALGSTARSQTVPSVAALSAKLGLSPDAIADVERGEMVQFTPTEASDRELAVGFVFFVHGTPADVRRQFQAASDLHEDPAVHTTYEITGSGGVADFAALRLQPDGTAEMGRYLAAEPGGTLNLSDAEIAGFRALGSKADLAAVEEEIRTVLAARLAAYRSGGLSALAPYARGGGVQRSPGDELRAAVEASRVAASYDPAFRDLLLDYPANKPADLSERFFWVAHALDDRPNYTLRHRLALPIGEGYLVCDREYYVSQGYNVMQAIAGFLPADGGTLVFYATRTSTDRAGGFGASVKHAIGRRLMARELEAIFEKARAAIAP